MGLLEILATESSNPSIRLLMTGRLYTRFAVGPEKRASSCRSIAGEKSTSRHQSSGFVTISVLTLSPV